ncbi:MAG: succinate dehydrogenase, cytochrome b556 subunit [Pseudomonadota bacterium]|nr:succinate dehydrogenase, cytochrome b556 subunit [Pseudomonadota bacterium]
MAGHNRPMSPHLQVYKPQLTSVLSILHRGTGIALAVGTLLLVWWLLAAATGERAFADVQAFMGSWLGRLLLFGWSYSLFYHMCNGIRHLFWDAGKGFDLKNVYRSGWLVVIGSIGFTAAAWIWGYSSMGAL